MSQEDKHLFPKEDAEAFIRAVRCPSWLSIIMEKDPEKKAALAAEREAVIQEDYFGEKEA